VESFGTTIKTFVELFTVLFTLLFAAFVAVMVVAEVVEEVEPAGLISGESSMNANVFFKSSNVNEQFESFGVVGAKTGKS